MLYRGLVDDAVEIFVLLHTSFFSSFVVRTSVCVKLCAF